MSTKDQQITLLLEALLHEKKEKAELETLFDKHWDANLRAIDMWQEAHPEDEAAWPDLKDLLFWLMEENHKLRVEKNVLLLTRIPDDEEREKSSAGRKPALSRAEVEEIRALAKGKLTAEAIAHSFNVSVPTVRRVLKGHGPYSKANGHG